MTFGRTFGAFALSAGLVLTHNLPANAQAVTLTSLEGGVVLRGEIIDLSDTHYTIETAMGPVRAEIGLVTCEGEDCPSLKPPMAEVFVSAPADLGQSSCRGRTARARGRIQPDLQRLRGPGTCAPQRLLPRWRSRHSRGGRGDSRAALPRAARGCQRRVSPTGHSRSGSCNRSCTGGAQKPAGRWFV